MKRNAITRLVAWKEKAEKQPMLITGMKGVGKTFLALDFAKSFYEGNIYVNFETDASICDVFQRKASSVKEEFDLIDLLCEHYQIPEQLIGNLLIILDEVAACDEAMSAIKAFSLTKTAYSLIVISSCETSLVENSKEARQEVKQEWLGSIRSDEERNIAEGFELLTLYPLEFDEFLYACGSEWYAEVIKGHYQTNRKIPSIVHNELITLFEDYLAIGGMPAAVNEYINLESLSNVAEVHRLLYQNMQGQISGFCSSEERAKAHQVLTITLEQLMKENKKFQFRLIRKGATLAMYKEAIDRLVENHYLLQCSKQSNHSQFKLYLPDVGILHTLISSMPLKETNSEDLIRKTLLENYTMQSLIAKGYEPMFWESSSQAKIDFVIQNRDGIIPLEAKIKENTRSKSISVFRNQVDIPYAVKISSKNYEYTNQIKYLPYYAIFCL